MGFVLPKWGGAMVHSDPQLTDTINLPVPLKDVEIVWRRSDLKGEKAGTWGNGVAGNGKIVANTFIGLRDNLVIYDYHGERLWSSGDMLNPVAVSSTPMVSIRDEVIACDNKTILMVKSHKGEFWIEWIQDIPYEGSRTLFPFSPTIVNNDTIILPTKNGPVYAFDAQTGDCLATTHLGARKKDGKTYYSTINSACVHDKKGRIYITAESSKPLGPHTSRLYAVDVMRDADNERDILTEAWYYPFTGKSQASPLFIDETIYFDAYTPPGLGLFTHQHIYAIRDKGERYKVYEAAYPHKTWFSFSKDPRGGFWYSDAPGKKIVRFKKEQGGITLIEEIPMKTLDIPGGLNIYKPMSCMTICGTKNPVMLVSAISLRPRQYVIAIELKECDNSVAWQIPIDHYGWNYAGGQFTILNKDPKPRTPRIVFGTYYDGVMAIGEAD